MDGERRVKQFTMCTNTNVTVKTKNKRKEIHKNSKKNRPTHFAKAQKREKKKKKKVFSIFQLLLITVIANCAAKFAHLSLAKFRAISHVLFLPLRVISVFFFLVSLFCPCLKFDTLKPAFP